MTSYPRTVVSHHSSAAESQQQPSMAFTGEILTSLLSFGIDIGLTLQMNIDILRLNDFFYKLSAITFSKIITLTQKTQEKNNLTHGP